MLLFLSMLLLSRLKDSIRSIKEPTPEVDAAKLTKIKYSDLV